MVDRSRSENRILEAAARVFAQDGYEATSMREIARAVGIRAPSLYSHFASKADLYEAVVEFLYQPYEDLVATDAGLRTIASHLLDEPALARLLMHDELRGVERETRAIARAIDAVRAPAIAAGWHPDDVPRLVDLFNALVVRLAAIETSEGTSGANRSEEQLQFIEALAGRLFEPRDHAGDSLGWASPDWSDPQWQDACSVEWADGDTAGIARLTRLPARDRAWFFLFTADIGNSQPGWSGLVEPNLPTGSVRFPDIAFAHCGARADFGVDDFRFAGVGRTSSGNLTTVEIDARHARVGRQAGSVDWRRGWGRRPSDPTVTIDIDTSHLHDDRERGTLSLHLTRDARTRTGFRWTESHRVQSRGDVQSHL